MLEYTSSITGVLRTVLIIIGLYLLVRLLGRLFMPFLKGGSKRQQHYAERNDGGKEGEVRIEYTNKKGKDKQEKGKSGEYIDFEEVD